MYSYKSMTRRLKELPLWQKIAIVILSMAFVRVGSNIPLPFVKPTLYPVTVKRGRAWILQFHHGWIDASDVILCTIRKSIHHCIHYHPALPWCSRHWKKCVKMAKQEWIVING